MKKLLLFTTALLLFCRLFAQMPQESNNKSSAQPGGDNGYVYGKITDSTGKGIANVSVLVLQRGSPFLKLNHMFSKIKN